MPNFARPRWLLSWLLWAAVACFPGCGATQPAGPSSHLTADAPKADAGLQGRPFSPTRGHAVALRNDVKSGPAGVADVPASELAPVSDPTQSEIDRFVGFWATRFGTLVLLRDGERLHGAYAYNHQTGLLNGTVVEGEFRFRYRETHEAGEGAFRLADDGRSFTGRWRRQGETEHDSWDGVRLESDVAPQWEGTWQTTYGPMRLLTDDGRIEGVYGPGGESKLSGRVDDGRLRFTYQEPTAAGEGWFAISPDSRLIYGLWRTSSNQPWAPWVGARQPGTPGRMWLVVLEARWEHHLAEREYAFGEMLKTWFTRTPHVEVRHRYFEDAATLQRYLREACLLPDPTVICVSSHGTPQGVSVGNQRLGAGVLAESLKFAHNVRLLHFSACSLMAGDVPRRMLQELDASARFPISGYVHTADWGSTAALEFLYFDLVLGRGMPVEEAARQLPLLAPFAAQEAVPGTTVPAAGFRLLTPAQAASPTAQLRELLPN